MSLWRRALATTLRFFKADQLGLFNTEHAAVQRPGSRGGRYYFTREGAVRYGSPPAARVPGRGVEGVEVSHHANEDDPHVYNLDEFTTLRFRFRDEYAGDEGQTVEQATVTPAEVDLEWELDAAAHAIGESRAFYAANDSDAKAIRHHDHDEHVGAERREHPEYNPVKLHAGLILTLKQKDYGMGSGGLNSAKVFWGPYSAPDRNARLQSSKTKYNSGDQLGIDPIYVLAHELHHAHGAHSEFDLTSDVVGVAAHLAADNRYAWRMWEGGYEHTVYSQELQSWVWRAKDPRAGDGMLYRRVLRYLNRRYPIALEDAALRSRIVDTADQWRELMATCEAVGKRKLVKAAVPEVPRSTQADQLERAAQMGGSKCVQLGLFDKPVQKPGSRGGKGYFNRWGRWEYGDRPAGFQKEPGGAFAKLKPPKKAKEKKPKGITLNGVPDLASYDVILVNTSAGKDSTATLDVTIEAAKAAGVLDRVHTVHCDLGREEWEETLALAEKQVKPYGVPFHVVKRDKSLLAQIEHERKMFPGKAARFCTSDHKTHQVYKLQTALAREIRERTGKKRPRILNVMGLRALESDDRAEQPEYIHIPRASSGNKEIDEWLPIKYWTLEEVQARNAAAKIEQHPVYSKGIPRQSCTFCVFAPKAQQVRAGLLRPDLLDEIVRIEAAIGHKFRADYSAADVKAEVERIKATGEEPPAIPMKDEAKTFERLQRDGKWKFERHYWMRKGRLLFLNAKVQRPGSRGGKGYFDSSGEWIYGVRPDPKPTAKPEPPVPVPAYEQWRAAAAEGKPLIAYHGSPNPFDTKHWQTEGSEYANVSGAYFTIDADEAGSYTKQEGKRVGPVYRVGLTFKNPASRADLDAIWKPGQTGFERRRILQERGFDGLIDDSMNEIVAFDPAQIMTLATAIPARQIETAAFKRWFGDSKVVDDKGEPVVVYHGSSDRFTAFDVSRAGKRTDAGYLGLGFYFAERGHAAMYAHMPRDGSWDASKDQAEWSGDPYIPVGATGGLYPVYLALKNPLVLHEKRYKNTRRALDREVHIREELGLPTTATAQEVTDAAIARGYDGVIFHYAAPMETGQEPRYLGDKEYVAFHPHQIKSALGNVGTFDPTSTDILKARRAAAATGQLSLLFGGQPKKPVQHPGSRGGHGYFDSSGEWIYGDRPTPAPPPAPEPEPTADACDCGHGKAVHARGRGKCSGSECACPSFRAANPLTYEQFAQRALDIHLKLAQLDSREKAWRLLDEEMTALEADYPEHLDRLQATEEWAKPPPEPEPAREEVLKSAAFKHWFGDWEQPGPEVSKVVKRDGTPAENYDYRPILAFHGTAAGGFRAFDPKFASSDSIFGAGFYFTEDQGIAEEYTQKDAEPDAKAGAAIAYSNPGNPDEHLVFFPPTIKRYRERIKPGDLNNPNWHPQIAEAIDAATEKGGVRIETFLAHYRSHNDDISRSTKAQGLALFAKDMKLRPVSPPGEVIEAYLNIRKPFDMDEPITEAEMTEWWDYCKQHAEYHGPGWNVDDLMTDEDLNAVFGTEIGGKNRPSYPIQPTRADLLKVKAYLRPKMKTLGWDSTRGTYKLEKPVPLHGIFHLSPPDVLTKGDFHYIITDAHHWLFERHRFTEWLHARGNDGVHHTGGFNIGTRNHSVWIAFKPEQIKATKNVGTFDPTTPDMYKGAIMGRLLFRRGVDAAGADRVCVPAGTMRTWNRPSLMFLRVSRDGFAKASQLGLFDKPVEKPGSRGGKGYYDEHGRWQYGERPKPVAKLPKPEPLRETPHEPERTFALTPSQGTLGGIGGAADSATKRYRDTLPESAKPTYDRDQGVEGWEVLEAEYERALVESNQKRLYKKGQYGKAKEIVDPNSPFGREARVAIRKMYGKAVKLALSKGQPVPREVVNQRKWPEFRKALDSRERYEKGWHTSFANKSIGVSEDLVISHGIKIKRQDGKLLTMEQRRHLAGAIDEISKAMRMGNLADVWRQMDVTVAHTNGKNPFLKKAGGLFVPSERTISVGITGIAATAHELLGHALDCMAGIKMGYSGLEEMREGKMMNTNYVSSVDRHGQSDNAKLIRQATNNMNNERMVRDIMKAEGANMKPEERARFKAVKVGLGHYWRRPFEVWARLCEQYVATVRDESHMADLEGRPELGIDEFSTTVTAWKMRTQKSDAANTATWYESAPGWWTKEQFAQLRPMVKSEIERRIKIIRTGQDAKGTGVAQQTLGAAGMKSVAGAPPPGFTDRSRALGEHDEVWVRDPHVSNYRRGVVRVEGAHGHMVTPSYPGAGRAKEPLVNVLWSDGSGTLAPRSLVYAKETAA